MKKCIPSCIGNVVGTATGCAGKQRFYGEALSTHSAVSPRVFIKNCTDDELGLVLPLVEVTNKKRKACVAIFRLLMQIFSKKNIVGKIFYFMGLWSEKDFDLLDQLLVIY